MQWVWKEVNFNCVDVYAVLEWANDTKLHVFATIYTRPTHDEYVSI